MSKLSNYFTDSGLLSKSSDRPKLLTPVSSDEIHLYYTDPGRIEADRLDLVATFVEQHYIDTVTRDEHLALRQKKREFLNTL